LMTRVLPEPAPAMIASGPLVIRTASRWASLSPSRSRSGSRAVAVAIMTSLAVEPLPPVTEALHDRFKGRVEAGRVLEHEEVPDVWHQDGLEPVAAQVLDVGRSIPRV